MNDLLHKELNSVTRMAWYMAFAGLVFSVFGTAENFQVDFLCLLGGMGTGVAIGLGFASFQIKKAFE